MKETMANREFKVLMEQIAPENVLAMAELITIKQTKTLIGYIGKDAITAHEKVYIDVMHKDEKGYVLSDYYDLIQDVALFLCKHFGKYLDDYLYTSKKNRAVTVKMECYYIIKRELYKRYSIGMKNCSLDALVQMKDDRNLVKPSQDEIEASYDRVEKVISLMNLGEKHLTVLYGRMNGMSNNQLATILHCTCAAVHSFRYVMQRRYNKVMCRYGAQI